MEAVPVALVIDVTALFSCCSGVRGGDGTKDCTLCFSTEAVEGNAAGPGIAEPGEKELSLISSHRLLSAAGSTEPLEKPVLLPMYPWP